MPLRICSCHLQSRSQRLKPRSVSYLTVAKFVPLGRPFLRNLFSHICRSSNRHHLHRIRLNPASRNDLRWWLQFLRSWSSISMIQISRISFDAATDASGAKGIGGVHRRIVFSEKIPSRHKSKKIDWKEMFAILHAFLLWHEIWRGGSVRIACDNSSVVDAINKCSIKGPAIVPLQRIFLIAAVSDIQIFPFWVPSEENMVADAASRFDYMKLANLRFQVSRDLPRPALLRRKLHSLLTTPSLQAQDGTTGKSSQLTSLSAGNIATTHSQLPSNRYRAGLLNSSPPLNPRPQNPILGLSNPSTFEPQNRLLHLRMNASTSSSKEQNVFMEKDLRRSDTRSHPISSSEWFTKLPMARRESTSKQPSALVLPDSYDLENLHGIRGLQVPIASTSPENMSFSNQMVR